MIKKNTYLMKKTIQKPHVLWITVPTWLLIHQHISQVLCLSSIHNKFNYPERVFWKNFCALNSAWPEVELRFWSWFLMFKYWLSRSDLISSLCTHQGISSYVQGMREGFFTYSIVVRGNETVKRGRPKVNLKYNPIQSDFRSRCVLYVLKVGQGESCRPLH